MKDDAEAILRQEKIQEEYRKVKKMSDILVRNAKNVIYLWMSRIYLYQIIDFHSTGMSFLWKNLLYWV